MIKEILKFHIMLLSVTFFFSCHDGNRKGMSIENKIEESKEDDLLERQKALIMDKKLESISLVIGDSIDLSNRLVLLYDGFDCDGCIDVGYEMVEKLDSITNEQFAYVISSSANIGRDQLLYNYQKYVYNDKNGLIRKELKFIYTPVLLSFDTESRINNVFYPSYTRNLTQEASFIQACIKNFTL